MELTYNAKALEALATTTIKTGPGKLHTITINTAGAAANTITVYDNTAASGTLIATIDGTTLAGNTFIFDCQFLIGLTVIIATGTAAKITVNWN